MACAQNGAAGRHSDPHIAAQVSALAQQGALITLADPVGLYIKSSEFTASGFETPDGADAASFFKLTRGAGDNGLRARFEVPPELGYTVSDISINGEPIQYGGQVVAAVKIHLFGLATDVNERNRNPSKCEPREQAAPEEGPGVILRMLE
jgi:hypothetical protein